MKTVYITGASAGLGRAIAEAYYGAGYKVGLIARDEAALAETTQSLGGNAAWAAADVSDYLQLEMAAQKLVDILGEPDIWINDAMATVFSRLEDIKPDEFKRAIDVTLIGSVYGLQIALKMMRPRGYGHIIQIGSALAYRAIPLQAPYCAAKTAIRSVVNSLRCEMIHDRSPLHITMVHMPAMNTPQFDWARRHISDFPQPVPPIYAPEACAKAVLWAAQHPQKREVWVGKSTIMAIMGNKFFPAFMDYYIAKNAYAGQFEKPAPDKNTDGNLFTPISGFHKTEGHFANRQRDKVFWIGTSWREEIALIIGILLLAIAVIAALLAI